LLFSVWLLGLGCSNWPRALPPLPSLPGYARGVVFEDLDGNTGRNGREPGVAGVRVSNGRQVVVTDRHGRFSLPVDDDTAIFVIKPTGMRTTLDDRMLPRFYYLHKPAGSPDHLSYPAVPASGPLPESIDFPLYRQAEPSPFGVLVVGDPQPQSMREVDHYQRDILAELPQYDAAFGLILGDLVDRDLSLYDPLTRATSLVGIPWYHVLGNHDMNLDARDDSTSDETFERVFGPSTYAFEYADVHFIVLDDVVFRPAVKELNQAASYRGGLTQMQLEFVANYTESIPTNERIVLPMHIPLTGRDAHQVPELAALFEILARHPHTLSISAHLHMQGHFFLGIEEGNPGAIHHHWNSPTASGSWWRGRRDERGIPHTTMRDGSPNGYSIITFGGLDYAIRFKAAGRPDSYQMEISAPDEVGTGESATIWANVFAGSERSAISLSIVGATPETVRPWVSMERVREKDPRYVRVRAGEEGLLASDEFALPDAFPSTHLWKVALPDDHLPPGSHWIEVESIEMFGARGIGRRIIRIVPDE
jgi:hypothetical protein